MTNAQPQSQNSPARTDNSRPVKSSSTALPVEWIERLFTRLSGMYGSKFADLWRGCDLQSVKAIWAEDLAEFTTAELKRGLDACRTRVFPPTLPEFMNLCRPPLDYEQGFLHAVEQLRKRETNQDVWKSPAVYWAAVRVGNDLFAQPYAAMKSRWIAALDEAIAQVKSGELPATVPLRREALPPPGRTMSREKARSNLAKIHEMLGSSRITQQTA